MKTPVVLPALIATLCMACGPGDHHGPGTNPNPPSLMGCTIFPGDNPWNQDISSLPVSGSSAMYIANMNPTRHVHPDWGNWSTDHYGIPWQAGTGAPPVAFSWSTDWGPTESDMVACSGGAGAFCYPIPSNALIEGGSGADDGDDRHLIYIDTQGAPDHCTLYEVYNAQNYAGAPWVAANGAVFHLGSDALRPDQWTSADAAGLPVFAGLVRYDEVAAGEIRHALRLTMSRTQNGFIHPATHAAGHADATLPPMGLRLRLRAGFSTAAYSASARVVLTAMQHYGLIVADNGSDWYVTGDSDDRWAGVLDGISSALGDVHGGDFEVVDTGPIVPAM